MRPAVGDDVVDGDEQDVVLGAEAQERARGRAGPRRDRTACAPPLGLRWQPRPPRGVGRSRRSCDGRSRSDAVRRRSPAGGRRRRRREGGAQRLVAANDLVQARGRGRRRPAGPSAGARRACCRRRCPARAGRGTTGAPGRTRAAAGAVALGAAPEADRAARERGLAASIASSAHRGRLEQRAQRQLDAERLANTGRSRGWPAASGRRARRSCRGRRRCSSVEHVRPDGGERAPRVGGGRRRRLARRPAPVGSGQRCAIRACRWASAAARRGPRRWPAPCTPGAAGEEAAQRAPRPSRPGSRTT